MSASSSGFPDSLFHHVLDVLILDLCFAWLTLRPRRAQKIPGRFGPTDESGRPGHSVSVFALQVNDAAKSYIVGVEFPDKQGNKVLVNRFPYEAVVQDQ